MKKLSKERLSLLSDEERRKYFKQLAEAERIEKKERELFETVFDDDDIETISAFDDDRESFLFESAEESRSLMEDVLGSRITDEDREFLEEINAAIGESEWVCDDESSDMLNEAVGGEGLDAGAWIHALPLKGIGKWFALLLGALAGAAAMLISSGLAYLASIRVKNAMSRMVEVIDMGTKKKQSFISKMFGKKYKGGEFNTASFRFIQEATEKELLWGGLTAARKLGCIRQGGFDDMASGMVPQTGSGLDYFRENVLGKIDIIVETKEESA